MAPVSFLLLLAAIIYRPLSLVAQSATPTSHVTIVGVVYCDTCLTNTFSRHSYFLPGADVHIQCTFKASSPKTREQMSFSVNRTTDKYGIYRLEVPQVEGVDCVDGMAIETACEASLIKSSSSDCDYPGLKTSTNEMLVKSKQANLCIYSLSALSYRPTKKNITMCSDHKEYLPTSFNSSKFFIPYFPWPPFPYFPPLPPLPSLPPLPPLPPLPFPFPFPPLPPLPPAPPLLQHPPPPPPKFNLGDPRTWIPNIPPIPLPLAPPPPPPFSLTDPRTWIPHIPPSPPNGLENQNP